MKSFLLIVASITLAVSGQFLLKIGMTRVGRIGAGDMAYFRAIAIKTFANPYVLTGLTLYVLSAVIWLVVLSRVPLSYAYPAAALGYVFAVLLAALLLRENVSALRWVGVLVIAAGVMLVARG